MLYLASRIMLFASILRIAIAIGFVAAITFGIYVLAFQSIVSGLVWIVAAVAGGWAAHVLFGLVMLLSGNMSAPSSARR